MPHAALGLPFGRCGSHASGSLVNSSLVHGASSGGQPGSRSTRPLCHNVPPALGHLEPRSAALAQARQGPHRDISPPLARGDPPLFPGPLNLALNLPSQISQGVGLTQAHQGGPTWTQAGVRALGQHPGLSPSPWTASSCRESQGVDLT